MKRPQGKRSEAMSRLSFGVLLVSQLLATTAFMFVVPFMPLYVQQLGVQEAENAAAWAGFINGASGATMAFVAPLWGKLSDRLGRKPMLLRATLTAALVVGSMGFVLRLVFPDSFQTRPPRTLYVMRV